jgi:hypothetical protein
MEPWSTMEMNDELLCKQTSEFFAKNNFVVIRNFIDENLSALLYQYALVKATRADFMYEFARDEYRPDWDGQFGDGQATFSYNSYGDPMMDTLLAASTGMIEKYTGLELIPNYTYWRLYQNGEVLARHKDRHSCEISITLCLGYNTSNLDDKEYNWPMWVETPGDENGSPVYMKPGDMIIYRGCDVDHWREKFQGLNHAQVFLHYNDKSGPYQIMYDGRPILGIPKKFQKDQSK